ncbi:MAG: PAS domain-containing protein [Thermoplasmatota archaeon]
MNVLIVDDEESFLDQADLFLEKIKDDIDVTTYTYPRKALEELENSSIDVIVSDYQMPDIDGLEFLKKVRDEREIDIPFIMFTGKGREAVAMKALNNGADRYLQKGGDPKSQYEVLAKVVEQEFNHYKTKKRNKNLLRDLEETFNTIKNPIFLLNKDHKILRTNKAAEYFFGKNKEEILGEFCHTISHDEDEPIENCPLEKSKETKKPEELEFYSEKTNKYFLARTNPVLDENGEIDKIVHQEIDITDMKKKEMELKKSKRLFESIFNDPKMFVGIIDTDGNLLRANRTSLDFINKSIDDLRGKKFYETPWWNYSEGSQKKLKKAIDQAKKGKTVNFEAIHKNDEGDEVKVNFSLRPVFDEEDEIIKLIAYGKDVRNLKNDRQIDI